MAEVTRDSKGLEVALVLDNTGSMLQSGKLQALKDSATTLIDTVWATKGGEPQYWEVSIRGGRMRRRKRGSRVMTRAMRWRS